VAANKFLEACVAQGVGWVGEGGEQVLVGFGGEIAGFNGHRILIRTSMTSDAIWDRGGEILIDGEWKGEQKRKARG
jgi:hypothetical protein